MVNKNVSKYRSFICLDFIIMHNILLAFDFEGNRVGYGKGFYDRYLYTLPANVMKIGISLFPPVEHIEDADEFDMPLDYCVTPKLVYDFTK